MIDEKLTQRPELNSIPELSDLMYIVDVSDPSDSPQGTSKKVTIQTSGFLNQGKTLGMDGNNVVLFDMFGTELSRAALPFGQNKISYDQFIFMDGVPDDLSGLTISSPFTVVRTVTGVCYFISAVNNIENFTTTRIYLNLSDQYADLNSPDETEANFYAWEIPALTGSYVDNNVYRFNFWVKAQKNPLSPWVSIDGILVKQDPANQGQSTSIGIGDFMIGFINESNFVMARVDALPYTNKDNLSLIFDSGF